MQLQEIIAKIETDEFREKEIILSSNSAIYNLNDFKMLSEAIQNNEWCRENLEILHMHPCDFESDFKIKGCKKLTNATNVVNYKDLERLILDINVGKFHHTEIHLHDFIENDTYKFNNENLNRLVEAINHSKWCQENLIEFDISNAQFTHMPDLNCKNLKILQTHSTPLFKFGAINCPNLEKFTAYNNNLRTPPNVLQLKKLKELQILKGNPISLLGLYTLLLMQKKLNFTIDDNSEDDNANLAQKFVIQLATEKHKANFFSRKININDLDHIKDINIDQCINNLKITDEFIVNHISFVLFFMDNVYYIEPGKKFSDVRDTRPPINFKNHPYLKKLNDEYKKALNKLDRLSKIWLDEKVNGKEKSKINTNIILNFIKNFIAVEKYGAKAEVEALESHHNFFWQQLTSDLDTLKEVLIATGKEQGAKVISDYEKKNLKNWDDNFNPLERILKQFKPYVDAYVECIEKPAPQKRLFGKNLLPFFKGRKKMSDNRSSESTTAMDDSRGNNRVSVGSKTSLRNNKL